MLSTVVPAIMASFFLETFSNRILLAWSTSATVVVYFGSVLVMAGLLHYSRLKLRAPATENVPELRAWSEGGDGGQ